MFCKNRNKSLSLLLVAFLLCSMIIFLPENTLSAQTMVNRIAGEDRFETAVEISKEGWEISQTVILARSDDFPDALAGTPLAYHHDAPILLTRPASLSSATRAEIQRLNAQNVIILGGIAAVSQAVENELKNMGLTVNRIGGENRYETAALIAAELPSFDTAVVAYGENFPDALAIGPYAARNGYPILLTGTDRIPSATSNALMGVNSTIVVGGKGVISDDVKNLLPSADRIAGADRYETAAAIINELNIPTEKVYVATGLNFADALTGSALAAKENVPIILVRQTSVPSATSELIKEKSIGVFTILGGTGAVSNTVELQLNEPEPEIKPEPPSGLWANAISENEIEIGWNTVNIADYYHVYYGYNYNGPFSGFLDSFGNKARLYSNSLTAQGIPSGTTSYYMVTTVRDGVESDYSVVVSATTFLSPLPAESLYLLSEDDTYLGKLSTNKFDPDSIFNEYGTYGSKFSSNSIWNEYGTYGSKYSSQSAFNDFTSTPPFIVTDEGKVKGRLTTNKYVSGAISPYEIYAILLELGL